MKDSPSNFAVTLSYFDFSGGRGEGCRMALHLAGVEFNDDRVKGKDWPEKKPTTPFGGMPVLEIEGKGVLAQSNVILGFIGSRHDLLPGDNFEAAQHLAILSAVEDLTGRISASMRLPDDEKKSAREELASGYMKDWCANMEKLIRGPFVAGEKISVADLKLQVMISWVKRDQVDYIPVDYFDDFPKLSGVFAAVVAHPQIAAFLEQNAARDS